MDVSRFECAAAESLRISEIAAGGSVANQPELKWEYTQVAGRSHSAVILLAKALTTVTSRPQKCTLKNKKGPIGTSMSYCV